MCRDPVFAMYEDTSIQEISNADPYKGHILLTLAWPWFPGLNQEQLEKYMILDQDNLNNKNWEKDCWERCKQEMERPTSNHIVYSQHFYKLWIKPWNESHIWFDHHVIFFHVSDTLILFFFLSFAVLSACGDRDSAYCCRDVIPWR